MYLLIIILQSHYLKFYKFIKKLKELSYLNKYIYKYKFYYLIGSFFILVSTFFAIIPATLIRETFNMIEEGYSLYILNEDFDLRENVFKDIYEIIMKKFEEAMTCS